MQWRKLLSLKLLVLALVVGFSLPVYAQVPEDSTDADASAGTTAADPGGVQFNPNNNYIGNPEGTYLPVSSTPLSRLTFLASGDDPVSITIGLINLALTFLGVASMVMVLYAGFKWFTARDNEEAVTEAKQILSGAVIGLVITLSAYGLAQLLFSVLTTVTEDPWF